MELSELEPWRALAALLDGNVTIALSEKTSTVFKVFSQGEMPNTGLDNGFILVSNNGAVRNLTRPYGVFRGNVAITVYVKANSDGTVKRNRIHSAVSQIERLINGRVSDDGNFFFRFTSDNIITPYTVNASTGYSMTVLNVEWHTT